jgi:hypothetical protein
VAVGGTGSARYRQRRYKHLRRAIVNDEEIAKEPPEDEDVPQPDTLEQPEQGEAQPGQANEPVTDDEEED